MTLPGGWVFARTLPELARVLHFHPTDSHDFAWRLMQEIEAGEVEIVVCTTHGWKVPAVIPPGAIPWKTSGR